MASVDARTPQPLPTRLLTDGALTSTSTAQTPQARVMAQAGPPLAMLAAHTGMPAALLLIQLPAGAPGKAAAGGPSPWAPVRPGSCSSGLLALAWSSPGFGSYLESDPSMAELSLCFLPSL